MYTVLPSQHVKPNKRSSRTFFAHVIESNLAPEGALSNGVSTHVRPRTCCPKPLEPYRKRILASGYPIRKHGYQERLELIFCVTTNERSDQPSSGGTGDDTWEEVRIQKRLDHSEMIYARCESIAGTVESAIIVQYPNEAPPERQSAVAPRLVLMLR